MPPKPTSWAPSSLTKTHLPKTKHIAEKAYMLLRLQSQTPTKPPVTTGYNLYKPHLQSQFTIDPLNTAFAMWAEGSPLFGTNMNMFMPRAHIPRSGGTEFDMHDKIEVKNHSLRRVALEEDMRHFIGEDFKASLGKSAGKLMTVEWWFREDEGVTGTHVVDEDGPDVWWKIAEVRVEYVDEDGTL